MSLTAKGEDASLESRVLIRIREEHTRDPVSSHMIRDTHVADARRHKGCPLSIKRCVKSYKYFWRMDEP
jgi:hypothetical protein